MGLSAGLGAPNSGGSSPRCVRGARRAAGSRCALISAQSPQWLPVAGCLLVICCRSGFPATKWSRAQAWTPLFHLGLKRSERAGSPLPRVPRVPARSGVCWVGPPRGRGRRRCSLSTARSTGHCATPECVCMPRAAPGPPVSRDPLPRVQRPPVPESLRLRWGKVLPGDAPSPGCDSALEAGSIPPCVSKSSSKTREGTI